MVISETASVGGSGVFSTLILLLLAYSKSILSKPIPTLEIIFNWGKHSKILLFNNSNPAIA